MLELFTPNTPVLALELLIPETPSPVVALSGYSGSTMIVHAEAPLAFGTLETPKTPLPPEIPAGDGLLELFTPNTPVLALELLIPETPSPLSLFPVTPAAP